MKSMSHLAVIVNLVTIADDLVLFTSQGSKVCT